MAHGNGGSPPQSPVVAELIVRRHQNGLYSMSAPTDTDAGYILVARAQEMLFARRFADHKPSSLVIPQVQLPMRP